PVLLTGAVIAADLQQKVSRDLPAETIHTPAGQCHEHAEGREQRLQRRASTRTRSALTSDRDRRERTRAVHELELVRPRDDVTLRARKRDVHLAAALGMPSDHGRTLRIRLVAITPLLQRQQDVRQLTP